MKPDQLKQKHLTSIYRKGLIHGLFIGYLFGILVFVIVIRFYI